MPVDEAPARERQEDDELGDEAVVVRGGLSTAETLFRTAIAHYDAEGEYAISVRSAPGMSADELAKADPPLRHAQIRETTAGAVRQAGFEIVRDEPPPMHALIKLGSVGADDDYLRITAIFNAPRPNPALTTEER